MFLTRERAKSVSHTIHFDTAFFSEYLFAGAAAKGVLIKKVLLKIS